MVEVENPGTKQISTLMKNVNDGSYVIPYFQRGFEWEPSMVSELFESILQNYYTGLLLFWELDDQRARQEEWDPIWGANLEGMPEQAVLDGQQRLSSLYYAIYNPEKKFPSRKSYYAFYIDLVDCLNEEYEESISYRYFRNYRDWSQLNHKDEWLNRGKVPLSILSAKDPEDSDKDYIHSREFQEWIEQFLEAHSSELPSDVIPWNVRDIFMGILNYNFVHYPLSNDRNLRDICNIFAKVNASGMKLSTFDLMNAFLYPSGVELRKDLWDNLDETLKRVDSNMSDHLLKIISLHKQNYCSTKYLYNLIPGEETVREEPDGTRYEEILVKDGSEFEHLWQNAVDYAEKARSRLMNTGNAQFGAIRTEFIPYGPILPVLAAILWEADGNTDIDDPAFRSKLKRWYWSAVFSQDYSGSSDTIMGRDFRDWKQWLYEEEPIEQLSKVDSDFIMDINLRDVDKGSGRYNAIICLLAINGAKDFYEGSILGTGDFSDQKINDHHIFPKKVEGLERGKSQTFESHRDSIANRTLILDKTNNKIKNKRPSEYIQRMIEHHGTEYKVKDIFKEHFISERAYQYLKSDDFDNFLLEREKQLKQSIISMTDLQSNL